MSNPFHDDPRLTAYALGELKGDERREVERLLAESPAARVPISARQRVPKMSCKPFWTVLLVAIVAPAEVFAAAGTLAKPSIALPPGSSMRQARTVLADSKYKFVTGAFLNSFTTLFYRGDTRNLGFFLNELSRVKGAVVSVSFSRKRGWVDTSGLGSDGKAGAYQWRVSHFGLMHHGRQFQVTVFLGDGKIDLDRLYIPPLQPDPWSNDGKKPSAGKSGKR